MPCDNQPGAGHLRPAIVVFEDRRARGVLRLLETGFRHCFCLLRIDEHWLLCDPLKGGIRLDLLPAYDSGDLVRHFAAGGRRALIGSTLHDVPTGRLGLRPMTCVEIVKRALGIVAPGVITPLQLHRKLISTSDWNSGARTRLDA